MTFDFVPNEGGSLKVLITGGAGFIGSHLCDFFLKKGWEVLCVDNLITGSPSNVSHLQGNPNFLFIEHDVAKPIEINGNVDYILHFASPASPVDYLKFPIQTLKAGSLGTHNALGLAKLKKAVFLLASTSEIYGDPLVHPQREDYWGNVNTIGPRGVYDEAKRFAEAITMAYRRVHNINVKIVRIFNTFGSRMRLNDGRVVPNFIYQALNNQSLTIYGDGSQTRSFCYVDDLVEGIYRLLMSDLNEPINLGNPAEMSILEFAKLILKIVESKSEITHLPLPEDDPRKRQPDISKARQFLQWEPKIGIEDGLARTIAWFKTHMKPGGKGPLTRENIIEALRDVTDPELGISVVDLELIKDVEIIKQEKGDFVKIKMTLTTPHCPLMGYIVKSVKERIEGISGVAGADVELIF